MSTTKAMLYKYLTEKGCFVPKVHPIVADAAKCISVDAPEKMKLAIALAELVAFVSHLRKPILFLGKTEVPINMISFILAGSGQSKDSSMNMVRKGLSNAYKQIDKARKTDAVDIAKQKAVMDGKSEDAWAKYYTKPRDLQAGLATQEGLLNHFSLLQNGKLGAGYIQSSEIGTEILTNGAMIDIIKTISIGYDLGIIPAKIIKSDEGQTDAIEGLPISATLFGSEDAILYDTPVKVKFRTMFGVQLARRCNFSFNPEPTVLPEFTSIPERTAYLRRIEEESTAAQANLQMLTDSLVRTTSQKPLGMEAEAEDLFNIYKDYNHIESEHTSKLYPMAALARKHRQWFALKLAGAYAVLDGLSEVTEENYIAAIATTEMFSTDLQKFEVELIKESYELFVQYMHYIAENGESTISIHQLRKMGYIATTGNPESKVRELITLASSYDKSGIYTADIDGVTYKKIIKTDSVGVTYHPIDITGIENCHTKADKDEFKQHVARSVTSGLEYVEVAFEELADLLTSDMAYTPYRFKDGVRDKDNVIDGVKFMVLDIDDSLITDEECHLMLEGVNHFISRSFDKDNEFKFKVLIELDAIVTLDDQVWKHFMIAVGEYLGLKVDILPKSQILFSYSNGDRTLLSELNGKPLETKDHILMAESKKASKTATAVSTIPKTQAKNMLANPMDTFAFAFDAPNGEGSRSLIKAAYYAKALHATIDEIILLMHRINDYWAVPMTDQRLEQTICSQIRRWE